MFNLRMESFQVRIGGQKILISRRVFFALLGLTPYISDNSIYKEAASKNAIAFSGLRDLAIRTGIPYPLFFAPFSKIEKQLDEYKKNTDIKIPTKDEIALGNRGEVQITEAAAIIQDLARKQEFLKNHVLSTAPENSYVGSLRRLIKGGATDAKIAEEIRNFFDLDLGVMQQLSKKRALAHIVGKLEEEGILVSFSSHNYMPQEIDKSAKFSGLCVKDKKFPIIFINTRDGDKRPLILETSGRQIFTLIAMVASIGMNIFAINLKRGNLKTPSIKRIYSISEEVLIPAAELSNITIQRVDDLKNWADKYKVTPSMFLVRLSHLGLISQNAAKIYREELKDELDKNESKIRRPPLPKNGYRKYNGERFSREVLNAYKTKKINFEQVKNVLFRKGKKMVSGLFQEYAALFT